MVLSYELILGATRVSKGGQKCKRSVESSSTLPRPFPAVRQRLRRGVFFLSFRQHYGKIATYLVSVHRADKFYRAEEDIFMLQ